MSGPMTYQPYKLSKLGVTDDGRGRWHVDPPDGPIDEAEQLALHGGLVAEFKRSLPGITMDTVRESLAQGIPILPAHRSGNRLRVWCEHEGVWHYHGACGSTVMGSGNGHRVADCRCSESPLKARGYIIHEVSAVPPIMLTVREWRGYGCPTCDRGAE